VHIIHVRESKKNNNHDNTTPTTLTGPLPLFECIVKAFKTHRAALDFDAGFVKNGFVHSFEKDVFWLNEHKICFATGMIIWF
jgi:hypothetical protein